METMEVSPYSMKGFVSEVMPIAPIAENCIDVPVGPIRFVLESCLLTQTIIADPGEEYAALAHDNCVLPGYIRTPATERGFAENAIDADLLAGHTALRRLIAAEEIAAAIAFLLSEDASAITGINPPVDAGFLAAAHWGAFGERPRG
jgi:hypothetical protein